jgi:hypothetical protein
VTATQQPQRAAPPLPPIPEEPDYSSSAYWKDHKPFDFYRVPPATQQDPEFWIQLFKDNTIIFNEMLGLQLPASLLGSIKFLAALIETRNVSIDHLFSMGGLRFLGGNSRESRLAFLHNCFNEPETLPYTKSRIAHTLLQMLTSGVEDMREFLRNIATSMSFAERQSVENDCLREYFPTQAAWSRPLISLAKGSPSIKSDR